MNAVVTITKAEALSVGLDRYFPGTACANGHVGEVYCVNDECCECNVGKLTPAQFAYLFNNEQRGDLDNIRKRVTTWQEWETAYAEYLVEAERRAAQRLQEHSVNQVQSGRRRGRRPARHSYRDPFTLFPNRHQSL